MKAHLPAPKLKRLQAGPKVTDQKAGPQLPPADLLRAGLAVSGGHQAWLCSQGTALGSCPVWKRLVWHGGRTEVTDTRMGVTSSPHPGLRPGPEPWSSDRLHTQPRAHPTPEDVSVPTLRETSRPQSRLPGPPTYLPHGSAPESRPGEGAHERRGGHYLSAPSQGRSF